MDKCENDDPDIGGTVEGGNGEMIIDKWFRLSAGLRFAGGILLYLLLILVRKSWADSYFDFVEKIINILGSEIGLSIWLTRCKSNRLSL
ncbi:hypothetical protein PTKIN_Ptkin01aG0402000 [Pterospermum kingtungense]